MRRRLARAVCALAAMVLAVAAAALGEKMLAGEGGVVEAAPPTAQAMARAALEGTVDEMLVSAGAQVTREEAAEGCGATEAGGDWDAPPWLSEVLAALPAPSQVLTGGGGAVVSLHWQRDEGQARQLGDLLSAAGWTAVDSGVSECATYVRGEGEGEWLMISQWSCGEGVVVLAQCV
ncbi:hypothetical protein [Parvibacter caecicola]|uniref:Uncharacterized protein n=1 Tax=Parvibacter caecicola TaxID=747645 RepID=A0A4T9T7L3_9ACTN|nr:hypothetical protein [Parvibacter caecicola]TJW10743.1 hypothetical protein E5982_05570 [Parvibacter caecicola]